MLNEQDLLRIAEITKVYKTHDSILFTADRCAATSSKLLGFYRRRQNPQERKATLKYCAFSITVLMEVLISMGLSWDELKELFEGALLERETGAMAKIEWEKSKKENDKTPSPTAPLAQPTPPLE